MPLRTPRRSYDCAALLYVLVGSSRAGELSRTSIAQARPCHPSLLLATIRHALSHRRRCSWPAGAASSASEPLPWPLRRRNNLVRSSCVHARRRKLQRGEITAVWTPPRACRMQNFPCASCVVEKIEERTTIWVPLPIFSPAHNLHARRNHSLPHTESHSFYFFFCGSPSCGYICGSGFS